jgi:Protein of unknown function (DUF3667)
LNKKTTIHNLIIPFITNFHSNHSNSISFTLNTIEFKMHTNLCKNCEHTFQGNFCSNCGQKTSTKRLDWNYVYDELKYTFLHINNGFLYTAKQLYTKPGIMVREFLEGKRIKHYKPILMVFVLAGITGLLMHYLRFQDFIPKKKYYNPELSKEILEWITKHYSFVELAMIPVVSIASWLSFRKWGYNFIENIIINSFASSQRLLFTILTFPILFYFEKYSLSIKNLFSIPEYLLTIWLYWQLFNHKTIKEKIWRLLLFAFLTLAVFLGLVILVTCFYLIFVNLTGFKPA